MSLLKTTVDQAFCEYDWRRDEPVENIVPPAGGQGEGKSMLYPSVIPMSFPDAWKNGKYHVKDR